MIASPSDTLQTAVVVADKGLVVSKADTLSIRQGESIASTLQHTSGLYVGDNGGPAGQKNINIRSLGSAHTAIYIDGVRVGNVQSGQEDLTNIGAEQFQKVIIDYAQNSISFATARPDFENGRRVSGQAALSTGSFGTWNPRGRLDFRLGKRTSLSASAAGLISKGNFHYAEGLVRENNDIRQVSGGIDVFGLTERGKWHAKAHYNGSDRGTPGSLSYLSTDRQGDRNVYVQGHLEERFSKTYSLNASTKYAFDRMDYLSQWGDSRYDQQEVQVNSAHKFSVAKWLDLSLAANFVWDKLTSTEYVAQRYSPSAAIGAAFRTQRFSADVAIEYNGAKDKNGLSRNTLSPSAGLRFSVLSCLDLTAFGRRAYRVPTFNELYYVGYGNPDLLPEDAFLSGVGLSFKRALGGWTIKASTDGFLNLLNNKIVSAPTQADPNIWLPYNIGKVRSVGACAAAGFDFAKGLWTASLNARYCFQSAKDITEGSFTFGQQVPYISKHMVSIEGVAAIKGWRLSAAWSLHAGRRDGNGEMPDWNSLDTTLSKDINFKGCGPLTLFVSGKNLTDCRYESVSGYPMPGRSFTGGFNFKF